MTKKKILYKCSICGIESEFFKYALTSHFAIVEQFCDRCAEKIIAPLLARNEPQKYRLKYHLFEVKKILDDLFDEK